MIMSDILEKIRTSLASTTNRILFITLLIAIPLFIWFCTWARSCSSCLETEMKCFESRQEALDSWEKDNHKTTELRNFSTKNFQNYCYQRETLYGCCYSICFPLYRFRS